MIATHVCGSYGIARLLCVYGLGSHYGPCTLGLEILGIPLVSCIVVVWHFASKKKKAVASTSCVFSLVFL